MSNNPTNISFEEFLDRVDFLYSQNPTLVLKYGQCVMNILCDIWPEKYNELTNSDHDCFYDDFITNKTLDLLEENWN